ncbi:DUF4149 domain-containing protein [Candidatus Pelagibacter sp.]|nr:DUF4149 domain-containing protein [Candidatus Pelagibacter sp.]
MQIEIILPSIVLGIMLFFSFAVAPIIFKVLKENDARKFVRTIFPYYYSINLILVSLVCIFLFYKDFINFDFYLLLSVAILFAISLFLLMPMINNARDQKKENKFKYLHAASVIINFLQIFILLYVLL